uniref:Uncharacterized protein n=1 Tax=Anguilla anguilla TaxID=7936 RepID=A0A0E9XZQ5_ANGAN
MKFAIFVCENHNFTCEYYEKKKSHELEIVSCDSLFPNVNYDFCILKQNM